MHAELYKYFQFASRGSAAIVNFRYVYMHNIVNSSVEF